MALPCSLTAFSIPEAGQVLGIHYRRNVTRAFECEKEFAASSARSGRVGGYSEVGQTFEEVTGDS